MFRFQPFPLSHQSAHSTQSSGAPRLADCPCLVFHVLAAAVIALFHRPVPTPRINCLRCSHCPRRISCHVSSPLLPRSPGLRSPDSVRSRRRSGAEVACLVDVSARGGGGALQIRRYGRGNVASMWRVDDLLWCPVPAFADRNFVYLSPNPNEGLRSHGDDARYSHVLQAVRTDFALHLRAAQLSLFEAPRPNQFPPSR